MTDLDMLRDALAERASRAPDTHVVLSNTTDGLRRLRSRRKATALAGAVAVTTGALVAGVALLNQAQPGRSDTAIQAATVPNQQPTEQLPTEPGIRPKLPFSVAIPAGYRIDSWSVSDSGSISTLLGGAGQIEVALLDRTGPLLAGTETTPTTVRGIPAQLHRYGPGGGIPTNVNLTWQIVPGKWATVTTTSEQQVRSVAESMTLTPSNPPAAGRLTGVPAGFSVTYWGRGNVGSTTVMICPDHYTDKNACAQLSLMSGTAPDKVDTPVEGQQAPLGEPDAAGVRQTPDGHILVRQVDQGHWAEVSTGLPGGAIQLRAIILAASAN
jgi:hypothetical protein